MQAIDVAHAEAHQFLEPRRAAQRVEGRRARRAWWEDAGVRDAEHARGGERAEVPQEPCWHDAVDVHRRIVLADSHRVECAYEQRPDASEGRRLEEQRRAHVERLQGREAQEDAHDVGERDESARCGAVGVDAGRSDCVRPKEVVVPEDEGVYEL